MRHQQNCSLLLTHVAFEAAPDAVSAMTLLVLPAMCLPTSFTGSDFVLPYLPSGTHLALLASPLASRPLTLVGRPLMCGCSAIGCGMLRPTAWGAGCGR